MLSGLRGFLRWLAGDSVKVEEGFNWVGRLLWREFEVLVVSSGNVVAGVCGGVWEMLGVLRWSEGWSEMVEVQGVSGWVWRRWHGLRGENFKVEGCSGCA